MQTNDTIVITFQDRLKPEQRSEAKHYAECAFPGKTVVILDGGTMAGTVGQAAMLERIEAKLDAFLAALAEDDDDLEPEYDLDGNPIENGERNQNESLD